MMRLIKSILLFIWQLPQHIAALIILFIFKIKKMIERKMEFDDGVNVYFIKFKEPKCFGVSLGHFILLDRSYSGNWMTINHEYGHTLQSHIFGPLYLFIIGLPSITIFRHSTESSKKYHLIKLYSLLISNILIAILSE